MIIAQQKKYLEKKYLVKFGAIPEVARFLGPQDDSLLRGQQVIIRTHRGLQYGTVMGTVNVPLKEEEQEYDQETPWQVVAACGSEQLQQAQQLARSAKSAFIEWRQRIESWKLDLQLLDVEYTVDQSKIILYVLNDRGAETTKLALQGAALGLGVIEVQPVTREGLVESSGGGCGSGGCGCSKG